LKAKGNKSHTTDLAFKQMEDYNVVLAGQFERDGFHCHYQTRPMVHAQAEGKNYEWFEGNTRFGKGERSPRIELPTPAQEASPAFDGLPILNKMLMLGKF